MFNLLFPVGSDRWFSPKAIIGRDALERAEIEQISFKLNKIFFITEETDTNKKEGATPDPSIKRGNKNRG